MIVEFLGTQGSGKTSLLPAAIGFLRGRGVQARTVVDAARPFTQRTLLGQMACRVIPSSLLQPALWQIYYQLSILRRFSFFARRRRLLLHVLQTQRARPEAAGVRERRVLFWFYHLAGSYDLLASLAKPDEALVFDDGFVHRAVHLNASAVEALDPFKIETYLDLIPLPHVLIVVRVPVDVCVKRVQARGVWDHFRGRTPEELKQYLSNAEQVVNKAVDHLRAKNCVVVEVDNEHDDLSAAIRELQGKLAGVPALSQR